MARRPAGSGGRRRRPLRLVVLLRRFFLAVVLVVVCDRRPRTAIAALLQPSSTTTAVRRGLADPAPPTSSSVAVGRTASSDAIRRATTKTASFSTLPPSALRSTAATAAGGDVSSSDDDIVAPPSPFFRREDVRWKLRPPPETPTAKKLALKLASNLIRIQCLLKRERAPFVLCPKGGRAVLEAHHKGSGRKWTQIGKFGITTIRGPPNTLIDDTIRDLYDPPGFVGNAGAGAIIYMFVEPDYRGRGLGDLALETIAAIHAYQNCDFTLLVADDDGSGKLVRWYETRGYKRAPKLQDMMGSPDGKYGVSMIAPTSFPSDDDFFDECKIRWW